MTAAATTCLVNGRPGDCVAAGDRGFQYGDGLFETIKVAGGEPEFWDRHLARLREGCARLAIPAPDGELLAADAARLCPGHDRAVLKIIVTRGAGGRGYRAPDDPEPVRVAALHPWPDYPQSHWRTGVRVRLCETRLADQPALAGIKHLNRLEQIVARCEWDDPDIVEGLMRDRDGLVIEGTMSNLFVVKDGTLSTPALARCGVAGVMRAVVLALAEGLAIPVEVARVSVGQVAAADELFLTNSVIGVWPVRALEGVVYAPGPVTGRLAQALARTPKG